MSKDITNVDKPHHRLWPTINYGKIPQVDDFIKRGEHSRPEHRWWVDEKPFANLTTARMHVADTLNLDLSQLEIASDVSFSVKQRTTHMTTTGTSTQAQNAQEQTAQAKPQSGSQSAVAATGSAKLPKPRASKAQPVVAKQDCIIKLSVTKADGSVMNIETKDVDFAIRAIQTTVS